MGAGGKEYVTSFQVCVLITVNKKTMHDVKNRGN